MVLTLLLKALLGPYQQIQTPTEPDVDSRVFYFDFCLLYQFWTNVALKYGLGCPPDAGPIVFFYHFYLECLGGPSTSVSSTA